MILAYYRLGKYEDARRSMQKLLTFARRFRMDNPLTDFGNDVYQPKQPINITYDAFGPPAALIRGLFEYLYTRRWPDAGAPHSARNQRTPAARSHPFWKQATVLVHRGQRSHYFRPGEWTAVADV